MESQAVLGYQWFNPLTQIKQAALSATRSPSPPQVLDQTFGETGHTENTRDQPWS